MNYLILKSIIEATIANFSCRHCGSRAGDKDVSVLGTAGNALNLEITCFHCKVSGVVKAEVNVLPQQSSDFANASAIIERLRSTTAQDAAPAIKDEDIVSLRESLKKAVSVEDLLK